MFQMVATCRSFQEPCSKLERCLDSQVAIASFSRCCDRFLDGKVDGKKQSQLAIQVVSFCFPKKKEGTKKNKNRNRHLRPADVWLYELEVHLKWTQLTLGSKGVQTKMPGPRSF